MSFKKAQVKAPKGKQPKLEEPSPIQSQGSLFFSLIQEENIKRVLNILGTGYQVEFIKQSLVENKNDIAKTITSLKEYKDAEQQMEQKLMAQKLVNQNDFSNIKNFEQNPLQKTTLTFGEVNKGLDNIIQAIKRQFETIYLLSLEEEVKTEMISNFNKLSKDEAIRQGTS